MSRPEDVRLYAILARKSARAVLFRRGPSKRVLLISWDTSDDTFDEGQWLNGRIYERRCDLSPDGDLLIYFAASYRKPYFSWTAISRPPFLTALALWPKGDAWGGGGLFETKRHLLLNHRANEMELAPDFRVPSWLKVTPFGKHPGWGEDDPIWSTRLERDGWRYIGGGRFKVDRTARVLITHNPPIVWEKDHPQEPNRYVLRMSITGIKEKDGPWYLTEHEVLDRSSGETSSLGRSDWADWSASGDLLYAQKGKLYRCECEVPLRPRMLQDFSDKAFRELAPPQEALRWPAK
jgi:hypothetical protein